MNYNASVKSSEGMNLKGERDLTEQKRFCIAMPQDLEEKVYELRKTDEYCRKSLSEIVRILIQKGLEAEAKTA